MSDVPDSSMTGWVLAGVGAITTTLAGVVAKLYQVSEKQNKDRITRLEMIVESQSARLEKHRSDYTELLKTNAELLAKVASLETMVEILKGEFGEALRMCAKNVSTMQEVREEIKHIQGSSPTNNHGT